MHDYDSVHGIVFVVMVIGGDGFVVDGYSGLSWS